MLKVMMLTAIKLHLSGDRFEPVNVSANLFYLLNSNAVLVGANGNEFEFKSEENAALWIEANILRVGKQREQDLANLLALEQKNATQAQTWLALEIQTILDRNAGLWGDIVPPQELDLDGGTAAG